MVLTSHSLRTLAIGTLAVVVACGGPSADASKPKSASSACRANLDDAVAVAVGDYIRAAKPKPERFLVAVGTDSALGDPGLTALQDKGPTYLFPGDAALQATVRQQLHDKGDYTTLLVVRKGATKKGASSSVRLNGHYIGGEEDGKSPGSRAYTLGCDSTSWRVVQSRPEAAT